MKSKVWCLLLACTTICGEQPWLQADTIKITPRGKWPGYGRGAPCGVATSGKRVFVAAGCGGLQIWDIQSPAQPKLLGGCRTRSIAYGIAVEGDHAYIADHDAGLQVINVSDPSSPQPIANCSGFSSGNTIVTDATTAYVAGSRWEAGSGGGPGIQVIDISTPHDPKPLAWHALSGSVAALAVRDSHLFVANCSYGLEILNISDREHPRLIGTYYPIGEATALAVSGDYVYVGNDTGLHAINISDPTAPQWVGRCDLASAPSDVKVEGSHVYAAVEFRDGRSGALYVIDAADPEKLKRAGDFYVDGGVRSIAFSAGSVVLADGYDRVRVLDVHDPLRLTEVGHMVTGGYTVGIAVDKGYAYVAEGYSGLKIIDCRDPDHPRCVGSCMVQGGSWAFDVVVQGGYAYVATQTAGLQVFDVRIPSNPKFAGTGFGFSGGIVALAVEGQHAYGVGSGGMYVFNIADPSRPYCAALLPSVGHECFESISIYGTRACVGWQCEGGCRASGLIVIDIAVPEQPKRAWAFGKEQLSNLADGRLLAPMPQVILAGTIGYVVTGRLNVIDLSNVNAPSILGTVPQVSGDVAFADNCVLVGSIGQTVQRGCLTVIDVTNPTLPLLAGTCEIGGRADICVEWGRSVAVSGRHAYVAAVDGLEIYELTQLPAITRQSIANGKINLQWNEPAKGMKLQRATSLTDPDWQDLIGSEKTNVVSLPIWGGSEFFRLKKP